MTARTTISLPKSLKRRMNAIEEPVNWSQIAARAFEATLNQRQEMKRLRVQISEGAFLLLVLGETAIIQIDDDETVVELALEDIGFGMIKHHLEVASTHPRSPLKP